MSSIPALLNQIVKPAFIYFLLQLSSNAYAVVSEAQIDELAKVGPLKHSVVAFKVGQIHGLERYGKIQPTKKFEMAADEFIKKIDVRALYQDVRKMMAAELTEEDVSYLIELSHTPLFKKYLSQYSYALSSQGYQEFKAKHTEFGLGIFQPEKDIFDLIRSDIAESKQMLRHQLVNKSVYWIMNLEIRKFYPRAALTYEQFEMMFEKRSKEHYEDNLDQSAFSRYFVLRGLTKEEVKQFIEWNRSPAMARYDNAFAFGVIDYLGRIEKQVSD